MVVGEAVDDEVEEHKEGHLYLPGKNTSVDVYYTLIEFKTLADIRNVAEGSLIPLERVDVCIETVRERLEQPERQARHRMKGHIDTFQVV